MLGLDLARLSREGSLRVEAIIAGDDPLWGEEGGALAGPVTVDLTARPAGTGEIVVRGSIRGTLEQECRRCLEPVSGTVAVDVTMVFLARTVPGAEDDGDVRVYDADAVELDLADAVREEVLLSIDPYMVCEPECRGLCPLCGINRNLERCTCTRSEPDPRWDALRALNES